VETATRTWFSTYQGLNAGRTSGWTSAMGIAGLVAAIAGSADSAGGAGALAVAAPDAAGAPAAVRGLLPCSAVLHGEYGLSGVSLGVPVVLGPDGVRQIVEVPLTPVERSQLHAAADKVRGLIERASSLLSGEEAF